MVAEQHMNAEANEPEILPLYEPPQYATHESLTVDIIEATPHIYTNLSDPFETPNPGLLIANGHMDGYRVSV